MHLSAVAQGLKLLDDTIELWTSLGDMVDILICDAILLFCVGLVLHQLVHGFDPFLDSDSNVHRRVCLTRFVY